ncbi:autoinducer binding domain-containing protein [Aeromonas enteropelogenes]|uniref:helix-turn-helix transcriptional regulator n=1 Tax=Aeromonas enteropelogenes TaxID=29489 RepID=UPI0038D20444
MTKNLLERLTLLGHITDPDELSAAIEKLITSLGFDYFRLAIIIPVYQQRPLIRILNSCPPEWIEQYNYHGMISRDPVIAAARTKTVPIRWHELSGTDEQMDVMVEAAKCGLRSGVSHPLRGPRGETGVLSFITERYRPDLYLEMAPTLAMVVPYVLDAALRACRPSHIKPLRVVEADCLFWVGAGKTTAEIGIIMGIPERTVNYHLTEAGKKLGANNRYNAVALALASGELVTTLDKVRVIDHINPLHQATSEQPPEQEEDTMAVAQAVGPTALPPAPDWSD